MDSISDEQLVRSCIAGNLEHGQLLYKRYAGYVERTIIRILNDRELALDLTQETFRKAFGGLKNFGFRSSFKTWITAILHNICVDFLRTMESRRWRFHSSVDDKGKDGIGEIPDSSQLDNPEKHLMQKELKEKVESALDKLNPDQKIAYILKEVEGFSYDEIAIITNTPKETVGSRIYYAKMKLRKLLVPYLKGHK